MSKIRIIKAIICDSSGKTIKKPNDEIMDVKDIEQYRKSLKTDKETKVSFTYEEI